MSHRNTPDQDLRALKLPEIWPDRSQSWPGRRQELFALLSEHVYGRLPSEHGPLETRVLSEDARAFAGKAVQQTVELAVELPGGRFAFPVQSIVPYTGRPAAGFPFFVHIAFRPDVPDKYLPAEEIVDAGFALLNFCYQDIAPDRDDQFAEGLPALYPAWMERPDRWGKIAMWAWAASRVLDFAGLEAARGAPLDMRRAAGVGHSRLGKTALWAGANDPRFSLVVSNASGCAGAALERGKSGEDVAASTNRFGYWFGPQYTRFAGRPEDMPFDQHFLLASCAPRAVYVASAAEDAWADPDAEFLSAWAAGSVYPALGQAGLVTDNRWPEADCILHQGRVAYHRRPGCHYLSRTDWQRFMAYANKLAGRP